MIWILTFAITSWTSDGIASPKIEFNNKESCLAAANEIIKQVKRNQDHLSFIVCAAKGVK